MAQELSLHSPPDTFTHLFRDTYLSGSINLSTPPHVPAWVTVHVASMIDTIEVIALSPRHITLVQTLLKISRAPADMKLPSSGVVHMVSMVSNLQII